MSEGSATFGLSESPGSEYSRTRRKLGIAYVGTTVSICVILLSFHIAERILGNADSSRLSWFFNILVFITVFELFSLPFDYAGFLIERRFGRSSESVSSYFITWSKAVLKHGSLLLLFMCATSLLYSIGGIFGLFIYSFVFSVLILAMQKDLAAFYSGIVYRKWNTPVSSDKEDKIPVSVLIAQCSDSSFTGGIVGLPGSESIVMPELWISALKPAEFRCEIDRRLNIINSGGRTKGIVFALLFNILGIAVCSILTSQIFLLNLSASAGILTMSFCFTIWSFLGLLILPYPSQLGTMEADSLTVQKYGDRFIVVQTIAKIDKYIEDEETRSDFVERIFHPIPTLANRLKSLEQNIKVNNGAWHCARYSITISLVGLGLLGRAVHCNAGRPNLWAMLPAD